MKQKVKPFEKFPYVCDKHDNVWKYSLSLKHFLKVTPWEKDEDRRVNAFEVEKWIEYGKVTQYTAKPKIFKIINRRWDNVTWSWEFDGDTYTSPEKENCIPWEQIPWHEFLEENNDYKWKSKYKLVHYQGHLYWSTPHTYFPRLVLYEFKCEGCPPKNKDMKRWSHIKHCMPVWSEKEQKWI